MTIMFNKYTLIVDLLLRMEVKWESKIFCIRAI